VCRQSIPSHWRITLTAQPVACLATVIDVYYPTYAVVYKPSKGSRPGIAVSSYSVVFNRRTRPPGPGQTLHRDHGLQPLHHQVWASTSLLGENRAAQKGVFHLNIRISNPLFIDVCAAFAAENGLKSRNVEKRINAV
jgi:hypothetical protein